MKVKLIILLVLVALSFSSCNNKKSAEKSIAATQSVSTAAPEYKMMIVAKLGVKPEKTKEFIEAAREMIEKSNKESGCTFYQLYQDPYDNSKFVFVEEYKNQAAVDAHFATDYFKGFGPKITDFITGPPAIKVISMAKEVIQ
jgi:quinol monooxygenase YgiN